jgi:hypothetical protein
LIHQLSHLAASNLPPAQVVEQGGNLILNSLGASRLEIMLWHEDARTLGSFQAGQRRPPTLSRGGLFVFSRPITLRGVEYGWFDLELPAALAPQAELLLVGELVVNILGQFAANEALLARKDRLLAERRDLDWQVKLDKLLSRAGGIVSARRKLNSRGAIAWLRDESLRLRLPLWQVAERVVEGDKLVRAFDDGRPGAVLRRTA